MKYPVKLAQLTETMEEATITKWHKSVGDYVEKKETLYEVETDKMTMEVESIDAGYLCEIKVEEDGTASVGDEVATLADSQDEC